MVIERIKLTLIPILKNKTMFSDYVFIGLHNINRIISIKTITTMVFVLVELEVMAGEATGQAGRVWRGNLS